MTPTGQEVKAANFARIIYTSRPFGYDESILLRILINARIKNARIGITGALICRSDVYLQFLEGPREAVESAYERIVHDDRHIDVTCLIKTPVTDRIFGDWAMLHDPAKSWLWTQEEVAEGAITKARPDDVLAIFERLSAATHEASAAPLGA